MRDNCFCVPIKERFLLTGEGSEKETFHLELDLRGTGISYSVGDCIAVYPQNDPSLVDQILATFDTSPDTPVTNRQGDILPFRRFLLTEANLLRPPKQLLEGREAEYLTELLPCSLSPQEFCSILSPIVPRFYSIASSMREVGESAHLTVTVNQNPPGSPSPFGTCSHFLCHRAPLHEPCITIYHQPSHTFHLPATSFQKPVIMVGPGTGVAPFRGFLQERMHAGALPKNWLFFGEQTRAHHFYYEHEWQPLIQSGSLLLDTAFSRDSAQKVYVQHLMLEKSAQLWQWLQEGAYFFVCGDASRMAKDVDFTLHKIVEKEGGMDESSAKTYIKNLKKEKRYLRDVY